MVMLSVGAQAELICFIAPGELHSTSDDVAATHSMCGTPGMYTARSTLRAYVGKQYEANNELWLGYESISMRA